MIKSLTLRAFTLSGFVAFLTVSGSSAFAQAPTMQAACQEDAQKLCKDVQAAKVPECLLAHEAELSETCGSFMYRFQIAQICQGDRERLCKDPAVPLGKCFQDNEKDLSAKCRDALIKGSKKSRAEKKADKAAPEPKARKAAQGEKKAEK